MGTYTWGEGVGSLFKSKSLTLLLGRPPRISLLTLSLLISLLLLLSSLTLSLLFSMVLDVGRDWKINIRFDYWCVGLKSMKLNYALDLKWKWTHLTLLLKGRKKDEMKTPLTTVNSYNSEYSLLSYVCCLNKLL